jgi:DNA-binding CsgD family transcriptional regulator
MHPAVGSRVGEASPGVDLWAPVGVDQLPVELVNAVTGQDWPSVRDQLATVMDAVSTDGIYGRQLLQLVMRLPLGVYPVFDRYRASIAIDHGDWDGLQKCLERGLVEAAELIGIRDIVLAPLDRVDPPQTRTPHHAVLFAAYEYQYQRAVGRYRHWAQRLFSFHTDAVWSREDVAAGRHLRYRRLHDAVALAFGEAQGGRLPVAQTLARDAQNLGDTGEPMHEVAHDLDQLVGLAMGTPLSAELTFTRRTASAIGPSPLGTWEAMTHLQPFFALLDDGSLDESARLTQQIAVRFGSPRSQLQSQSWRVAADLIHGRSSTEAGLPALLAKARSSSAGLKTLPLLLLARTTREPNDFRTAEVVARSAGCVWAQVSALTWLVALDPQPVSVRWLHRLLETTGWRRPVLVPASVAADAALGLAVAGKLGVSTVELAAHGGRANVTIEVAMRHMDGAGAPRQARVAAIEALGKLGTTHSREVLHRVSRRTDDLGAVARRIVTSRAPGTTLSERELEVLDLARRGLTNRDIAESLGLSPHTIARHLSNARAKLGAANRAEAAAKFEEMKV